MGALSLYFITELRLLKKLKSVVLSLKIEQYIDSADMRIKIKLLSCKNKFE